MKTAIAATVGAAAALVASSALGVAAAEAPTTSAQRTVAVQGVGTAPLPQGASAATATSVYRQALAAAVADGQSKAQFLAGEVAATLGPAQGVAEGGGDITCANAGEGYAEYEGEQPDFGYAPLPGGGLVAGAGAPAARPQAPHKRRRKHAVAKAAASSCTLSAQVALVYAMG